jgi:SAM-dependent methyltransferase
MGYKAPVSDGRKGRGKAALSRKIRQGYETLPYPAVDKENPVLRKWRWVPIDWINVLWQPARRTLERVLVAGCGTGLEAFWFQQRFPSTRIVGVDYSDRALAIARKLQRDLPRSRQIHFVRADFAAKNFKEIVGGEFDLISCHGVLTYVPEIARALQNLANCLTEDGALYLGVNGSRHFSTTWRPALRALGLEIDRFADGPALRKALKICDALTGQKVDRIAKEDAEYLSSDLFGPLIANLPLNRWETLCRAAGLHFLGSREAHRIVRQVVADDLYELLLPRSRTELYELAERIAPSSFHWLVFTAKPAPNPPWQDRAELLRWRVFPSVRRSTRWPKISGSPGTFRNFTIKSPATNTIADIYAPQWVLKILQESNGIREVREILGEASSRISSRSLRKYLYLLYLLAFINLQPPLGHSTTRDSDTNNRIRS